jgi:hypothetical protein
LYILINILKFDFDYGAAEMFDDAVTEYILLADAENVNDCKFV